MGLLGLDVSCVLCQLLAVLLVGALTVVALLRLYAYVTCGLCVSRNKMEGKTALVTGANSGIGKETARDFAKRGARVIMACRNLVTANEAKDEIVKSTGNPNVIVKELDLSSQKSIREFAADINKTESKLHVLVHNAGTAETFRKKVTEDGVEYTMATNHYGPFLLTHLLVDLLKKSAPSRIIVVASELYRLSSLNLDNLNPVNTLPAYLYYVSKYANICFTNELACRLEGTKVTANCLHPGMIDSGIWRNVPFPLNYPTKLLTKAFFKTPEQGAQTSIYLAVSEEVEGISGKYFRDCKEAQLNSGAQDMGKAKKLWELSEAVVKLTPDDPKI